MHVQDAERGDVDDRLRNDLSVTDDDDGARGNGADLFDDFRMAHARRLMNGERVREGALLHGGLREFPAPAFGPVGLCEDGGDFMARFEASFERGHGERGRSHEDEPHGD